MTKKLKRPIALIVLDGWGISPSSDANAIAAAHTPYYDEIRAKYPWTKLSASGAGVGLAEGTAGNAEIGHMNIGAGRVVRTVASKIHEAIATGSFFDNEVLAKAFAGARERGARVHLVGLLSDADVHCSMESMYALLRFAKRSGIKDVVVHGILDGRDVPQRSADIYVEALEIKLADIGIGKIATLCGRHYGMDSSENWERTARAYTMMVHGEGERARDAVTAVRSSFLRGISDEFIAPIVLEDNSGEPVGKVQNGDLVIFFNHRADTMRQLARSLAVPDEGLVVPSSKPNIEAVCMTEYDPAFGLPVAFEQLPEYNSLAAVLSHHSVHNYRISETERFPHVSRILNCGLADSGPYEQRIEIPATDAAYRESEPEMRSFKIGDQLLRRMEVERHAFYVVNFPAPGLLAETGNFGRTVEAVQYIDTCLGGIVEKANLFGAITVITSTHGNCEQMPEIGGLNDRFATTNPVPFHIIDDEAKDIQLRPDGSLKDVAPTLLNIAGIKTPAEMTGSDLRLNAK